MNPREYADPRKHGPEYLARARRPLGGQAPDGSLGGQAPDGSLGGQAPDDSSSGPDAAAPTDAGIDPAGSRPGEGVADRVRPWPPASERRVPMGESDAPFAAGDVRPRARRPRSAAAVNGRAQFERSAAGPTGAAAPARARGAAATASHRAAARGSRASAADPLSRAPVADLPLSGTGAPVPWFGGFASDLGDPTRRFLLALIAWPPIGIALATAIGSATGCPDASATCTDAGRVAPWLAQAAILGLLLALPTLAAILAAGSVTAVVASVPITALLVALGANYDPGHATVVLAVLLAGAWAIGVGIAAARRIRPPRRRPTVS